MENGNPTLRDVTKRRAAIRDERQQMELRMRLLASEDQELAVAERVLSRLASQPVPMGSLFGLDKADAAGPPPPPPPPQMIPAPPLPPLPYNAPKEMTIEEVIAFVLDLNADPWMTANEIQEQAKAGGKEIPMSSLSPTLSNMKKKEAIERDGLKVALASRINKKADAE
jgi:hypothetical protein